MYLLTIYPIQSCNLRCEQCPMKKWLYPVDKPGYNDLTNERIFHWLDTYCPPYQWLIEISGGEPGLYPGIDGLVKGLNERGYSGLIKTNGMKPIPPTNNFRRIAAWHKQCGKDGPPDYFDEILILRNPEDCWEDKKQYCIDHHMKYTEVGYRYFQDNDGKVQKPLEGDSSLLSGFITHWTVVYSSGQITGCYHNSGIKDNKIQTMHRPYIKRPCKTCVNVKGFELFYTEEQKREVLNRSFAMKNHLI